ncbi:GH92 family glycosyl hydrolase [Segatella copri]|uniref:GH92 family glycosyl hydrolase n=1 Tax=Segatella copri TaxID=165179 RepID=UPI003F59C6A4
MKRSVFLVIFFAFGFLMTMAQDFSRYVDPRIGSEGLGRTFPGPCMPYGMAKPGPDAVSMPNAGWAPMPVPIKGFSQMHVSGTGGGQKYGNILIQPFLDAGDIIQKRVDEKIALGYYACTFENGIRTEITASERCAFYRLDYGRKQKGKLLIDVATFLGIDTIPDKRETQQYVDSYVTCDGKYAVSGWSTVRGGWNNGGPYTVYFYLQSDVPLSNSDVPLANGEAPLYNKVKESKTRLDVAFSKSTVNLKVGISHISIAQARKNIPSCGFDAQLKNVRKTWNGKLGKIEIAGTEKQKRMFYTALYHTMLMPVDKSGENPHFSATPYYDDYYAIWDTYRTSMPLLTLIEEPQQRDMVNSLLNIYKHDGYMPDARSGNWNGRTQGGSNADIVIADAFAKGMKGIDYQLALKAMIKDAEVPPTDDDGFVGSVPEEKHGRGGLMEYNTLGYIPYGIDRAGNRTVEYSYDDWCIAQVAKGLGFPELYDKYMKRSHNWRNLWRSDYEWQGMKGFIMPRDADGRWLDSVPWGKSKVYHPVIPYHPDTKVAPWYLPWWSTFFYEALSAEYSLSIPHDVPGLIEACGGKDAFIRRLDTFFANGHFNVANEPSFMTPYLYHWVERPDLSIQRIQQIVNDNYDDSPGGLPGNDDGGAMSSWLVFNMLGFYPIAGQNLYIVGSPMIPEYTIHLSNGKDLKVVREGEQWKQMFITHDVLINGGKLVLPDFKTEEKGVDKTQKLLIMKGKEKSTVFAQPVDKYLKTIPAQYVARFIVNRQYRNWEVGVDSTSMADTLILKCNQSLYLIPRKLVDEADGFCWDSPQKGRNLYVCDMSSNRGMRDGTFLFISRKALRQLQANGSFVYNGILWRKISADEKSITVKAEQDETVMQIAVNLGLPWVLRMDGNPLGIDWRLEKQ